MKNEGEKVRNEKEMRKKDKGNNGRWKDEKEREKL